MEELYKDCKKRMENSIGHLRQELGRLRTGSANGAILEGIKVDYYGTPQALKNIAHISVPEAQMIVITPFDPSALEMIETAILSSDLGMNPNNDGNVIRLMVPVLTEERRTELIKVIHKIIEDGRVAIRNLRRDANDQLKKIEKDKELSEDNLKRALDNVQEDTDMYIEKLNTILDTKEKELLL